MSTTSHSKILLSIKPQDMPGMSLSLFICLSCLPSRLAAELIDMSNQTRYFRVRTVEKRDGGVQ